MFCLKQLKTKINSFEIRGEKLLYLSNKSLYFDDVLLKEQNVCCFVRGLKERIVFSSWDSVIYTFTGNKVISLLEGYSLSEKKYGEDKVIISQRVSRGVFNKFVFDLSTGSILKKIDAEPSFISSSSEIFTIETTLKSLSLLTGQYEWEIDLGALGTIEHLLGSWNQCLWVWLKGYQCVGIDVNTGQIRQHWHPFNSIFQQGSFFFNFPKFDGQSGKIYFFERNYYLEIDLSTQQTHLLWQDEHYQINAATFESDYIYFIGSQQGSVYSNTVGVFDRNMHRVVWSEAVELADYVTFTQAPQVGNGKIYVLDNEGTLRIYHNESIK